MFWCKTKSSKKMRGVAIVVFLSAFTLTTAYSSVSFYLPHIRTTRISQPRLRLVCQQETRLGDVVMSPCKTLCPGCEPWICPLAPKNAGSPAAQSEAARRLLQLQEELAAEAQRELLRLQEEAEAAGVIDINSEVQWREIVMDAPVTRLVISLWGSRDCRKCKAMKPRFIKLAANLKAGSLGDSVFNYIDARGAGNAKVTAGVRVVPLLQLWRGGQLLESYLAEGQLGEAEEKMRDIILRWSAST